MGVAKSRTRSTKHQRLKDSLSEEEYAAWIAKRDALILQWIRLPAFVVNGMWGKFKAIADLGYEEAVSSGMYGLLVAAECYDEAKGFKFSTYAHKCIRFQVIEACKRVSIITVPDYLLNPNPPKDGKTACYEKNIEDARRALSAKPLQYDGANIVDRREAEDAVVEREDSLARDKWLVMSATGVILTSRERFCLLRHYLRGQEYAAIGRRIGICREAVRQIVKKAVDKLKAHFGVTV